MSEFAFVFIFERVVVLIASRARIFQSENKMNEEKKRFESNAEKKGFDQQHQQNKKKLA